jgi:hypothetical protein
MKQFVEMVILNLSAIEGCQWGIDFVEYKIKFHRQFGKGLTISTWHDINFFNNVLFCLNGGDVNDLGEPIGEYKNNFKKLIDSDK